MVHLSDLFVLFGSEFATHVISIIDIQMELSALSRKDIILKVKYFFV